MKEVEMTRLSEQLGVMKAKENQIEMKHSSQMKQLKLEMETLQEEHEQEVSVLYVT